MTDDPTLTAVDERGRAAAAGVGAALADRPVPAFEPDLLRVAVDGAPSGSPWRRSLVGLLAAAAAVLVVVAAVVALAAQGDEDSTPADPIDPRDLRRYVLADPPEGYGVGQVLDPSSVVPDGMGFGAAGAMAVYGPDVASPRLGTFVWDDGDDVDVGDEPSIAEGRSTVEVPGRRAWSLSDLIGGEGALLVDAGSSYVAIFGVAAGSDALAAAAAEVTVTGDRAEIPARGLPDGWSALGDVGYAETLPGFSVLGAGGSAWAVSYSGSDADGSDAVLVRAVPGSVLTARSALLTTTDVTEVEVRGHDALLARSAFVPGGPPWLSLRWEERPGEVVEVSSASLTEDELLAQAEDLEVVGADGVDDLRRQALETGADAPGAGVVGRGRFADGSDWVLLHDIPGLEPVTLRTTTDQVVSGSHGSSADPGSPPVEEEPLAGSVGYGMGSETAWAFGLLSDDVVEVRVRAQDGAEPAPVTIVEGDGFRGWVAELPPGSGHDLPPHEVRAIGADGRVLQTMDIGG